MRKLVLFAVPFAAPVVLVVYGLPLAAALALVGLALAAFAVIWRSEWRRRGQLLIALAGLCIGLLYALGFQALIVQPVQQLDGQTCEASALICDYPEPTQYGCRVAAEVPLEGRSVRTLLYLDTAGMDLKPGDRVQTRLELHRSDRTKSGEESLYYQAKGIRLIGYARGEAETVPASRVPLRLWPVLFSRALRDMLAKAMPAGTAGLVQALLTGDRSGLSYAQMSDMKMAGVSHMIAISGMHVSILLGFFTLLTGRRRLLTALLGIPLVLFFVLATGASPSVVRAAVMQIIFLIAPLLWRENDPPTSLCAALLLLLLRNPYAIADLSLQLSFGSMAGILFATRPVYHWLAAHVVPKRWTKPLPEMLKLTKRERLLRCCKTLRRKAVFFVFASVSTTLGALIFTVPVIAIRLGTFSLYGVLSNLVILWAVSICFVGGAVTGLLAWLWLPLGQLAGWVVAWPVRYILWMAKLIAHVPFALLTTRTPYLAIWLVVSYLVLIPAIRCRKVVIPTLGILAGLLLTVALTYFDGIPNEFRITALDVGQGQCICLQTPDFRAVYDCGGSNADDCGQHAAEHFLSTGQQRIDALILSHYDEDHIGGLPQLLYRVEVGRIYLSPNPDETGAHEAILQLAAAYDIPVTYVETEVTLPFSGGSLTIFPPPSQQNDNSSLAILFSCGKYDMLASGDMDRYDENLLLHQHLLPRTELYIAGHHGAKESSSEALLRTITPDCVLISVGTNRYGQPSEEALSRFAALSAAVYRTDQNGDISIER